MRKTSQHYLAESLLKATRVQDLLYFPGRRDGCSNPLAVPQGRTWAQWGRHPALAHTFSGPATQLASPSASAPAIVLDNRNTAKVLLVSPAFS